MPSTVIRTFTYDEPERVLRITFTSGRIYAYRDVPPEVFRDMKTAFAKGVFFNQRVRDRYKGRPEPTPQAFSQS
jgi:hypothetical protein